MATFDTIQQSASALVPLHNRFWIDSTSFFDPDVIIRTEPAWESGSVFSFPVPSYGLVDTHYLELSSQYALRSGQREDQNGTGTVEQVPFSLGIPGPFSLRGRSIAYVLSTVGTNPSAVAPEPTPLGF